jgi:3-methylcrotonyl-CoA carboxylase alpha subunit
MFHTVLVANRGEIACRVIATCRRLGLRTVAVYSDADAGARHVRLADVAVRIGPAPARESYLRGEAIIAAAQATGAQAIHPGYGFLSENAGFAGACAAAGLVFIGPPVAAIRAMGSKRAARQLMQRAGVPVVPGYDGERQDVITLQAEATRIGYPVLIKPSAGGGGKGMRVVSEAGELPEALAACQREAQASFGDAQVLLERYLARPRHIEVQVFGDAQGHILSLFERDCSAQRRHQKVVEEAPAPRLDEAQRNAIAAAAREAARAVAYVGAGTIEFIVDGQGAFHFMEMNTRLQVEHPVTEMITGIDLVEWQLRVAAGEALPLTQEQVRREGHAIELRLYAEQPGKGFLPSTGRISHWAMPASSRAVRIDSGVEAGDEIGPHYDPMLAKLIAWGATRDEALAQARAALAQVQVVGVGNNVAFLARLLAHAGIAAAEIDTGFIERHAEALLPAPAQLPAAVAHAASRHLLRQERAARLATAGTSPDPHSPWAGGEGWRLNGTLTRSLAFIHEGRRSVVQVTYAAGGWQLAGEGEQPRPAATVVAEGEVLHVFAEGEHWQLQVDDPLAHAGSEADHGGGLVAPMPGAVIALCVAPGAVVAKGEPLLVMEAMKMEHTLRAPAAGRVAGFHCQLGDQVKEGATLVDFEVQA